MATKQTAEQAYNERATQIEEMLTQIQAQMKEHRTKFQTEGRSKDWGFAGDLQKVLHDLTECAWTLGRDDSDETF